MRVGIIIIVYNLDNRVFILQVENIKRFCRDKYTIEVIDNSSDEEKGAAIRYHSEIRGLSYTKTDSGKTDASFSHAFAANFAYKRLFEFYDYFFFLDHDCIPVKPFSVVEILGDKKMAGVMAGIDTKYYWPGCFMFNNNTIDRKLIKFNPIQALRCDTGGELYKAVQKYGDDCIFFDEVGCYNDDFRHSELYYFYMVIQLGTFMHFLNSSGWNPTPDNEARINSLINIAIQRADDLIQ